MQKSGFTGQDGWSQMEPALTGCTLTPGCVAWFAAKRLLLIKGILYGGHWFGHCPRSVLFKIAWAFSTAELGTVDRGGMGDGASVAAT